MSNPKKILVVDDSKTIRTTAALLLHDANVEVSAAEDGYSALRMIEEQTPDLILVDALMPRLNGFQLIRVIKSHPKYMLIPIVMLTGKDTSLDRARADLTGADGFFVKPFNRASLTKTIERFFSLAKEEPDTPTELVA